MSYSSMMDVPEGFNETTWPAIKKGDNFLTQDRLYRAVEDAYIDGTVWVIMAETPDFEVVRIQHGVSDLGYAPKVLVSKPPEPEPEAPKESEEE